MYSTRMENQGRWKRRHRPTGGRHLIEQLGMICIFIWIPMCFANKHSDLRLLDSLLEQYDRRATPTNHIDDATNVTCEFYIRSFGSIDPSSMDYQVDLYLRQSWVDNRFNHKDIRQPLDLNDPNLVKAIWKPEVYFPNAKEANFQFVTVPNVLIRIDQGGHILYMLRLKLTFACMMEMSKFPLDSQVCTMEIASFSKTTKELTLSWKSTLPIKMYKQLKMPQFQIVKIVHTTCGESIQIGNYSCLVAEFHLKRSIGFHLVQSYLPTILIVAISWVSFWMDVDSVPARTTLGVTTLLAVSTKSGIQDGLPQVSYVKAIDVWMGACTAFVFTSLLEFTLVNCLWRRRPEVASNTPLEPCALCAAKRSSAEFKGQSKGSVVVAGPGGVGVVVSRHLPCQHQHGNSHVVLDEDRSSSPFECRCYCIPHSQQTEVPQKPSKDPFYLWWHRWKMKSTKKLAQDVDEACRYLFPLAFGIFNVFYWTYYLCF